MSRTRTDVPARPMRLARPGAALLASGSTPRFRRVAVLLASTLLGCRARPAAPAPDAGTSSTVALAQPLAAAPCDEAWRAAQVDVAFKESPEDAAGQRTGPRLERRFTVARHLQGVYRHGDQWASVLEYESGPVRGGVSYGLTVPDVLSGLEGQQVAWASHREPAACLTGDGDGDGEHPALLAGDTLRDARGGLLLLTVPSAPTTPEGEVLLPPGLVPELRVRWEEAGCSPGPGTPSRGIRLRFEGARDAGTVSASVGETRHLMLGGARYEVRVARARAEGPGRCGQAVFALFREGLRTQRRPE